MPAQHEDRMRAQHELGGGMMSGQGMARMLALTGEAGGFESGPASSSGSLPHSPRQQHQVRHGGGERIRHNILVVLVVSHTGE